MQDRTEHFSSRWGLMLAMLGMAVGTGNIWRFPRIAATNGGGSFLVAWVIFLFLWSLPLILVEFAMGKSTRHGTVASFVRFMGARFAWMGAWVAWVAAAIGFYYAVVMGWTLRYFWIALTGQLSQGDPEALWNAFAYTPSVLVFHALALGLGVAVVAGGVRGIERVARVLMPALLLLVVVLVVRAVTLPGAVEGLNFLFRPRLAELANYRVWLEALTQNAWDTGAGFGLVLTYAIYARRHEDTSLNAFLVGFGNNSVSLLAGIMVLCTVFSLMPDAADQIVGATNEGLTFVWIPQLFNQMPAGSFFMTFFFLALVVAAWTSLVAMFELVTRVLVETGIQRRVAVAGLAALAFLAGVPSALRQEVFLNQDFVWSVGLMASGFLFAVAVLRYGVERYRRELINGEHQDLRIGRWWNWAIRLVVVESLTLIVWWFWQVRDEPLLGTNGLGNLLLQWGLVLALFLALNNWLVRRLARRPPTGA
jgi:NSS family neurotransmitter:Na+ symporter